MALHNYKKKRLPFAKFAVTALFVFGVLLSFFFLPYYTSEKKLAWSFVWDIRQDTAPVVAALQFGSGIILVIFFVYLLRLQRVLKREKEELASAITNLEVGFYKETVGDKSRFVETNEGLLKILNHTEEQLFALKSSDIFASFEEFEKLRAALLTRGSLIKEVRFKRRDGQEIWVVVSSKVVKNDRGEAQFFEHLVMDVSERKWMEEEVCSAYLRFESVIQNTPNIAIQGYALDSKILEWNHASEVLYGYTKHEAIGRKGLDFVLSEKDAKDFEEAFARMKESGRPAAPREWKAKHKSGREFTVYSSLFPILQNGHVIEIYRMDVDISDRVETEKRLNEIKDKLESLALKDALTEIYNFRYFRERLAAEFERAKRTLSPISIMMIDLDYFKSINDTYGHQFGDKVLRQVARFLKTELRANDVVARWGGEEFAIILPDTNRTDALGVGTKILELFRTRSFGDGSNAIKLKSSIGVVSYPEDPLFSVEEIIDGGEEGIYHVKERGGDGVSTYGHDMGEKVLEQYSVEDRKRYVDAVKQKLSFYAVRSERSILEAIYSLAKSIEMRDKRTREHCDRMVELAEKTARRVGMNELEIDNVRRAAMLHDIGKIGISDAILLKPGRLTPEEYEVVKKHPVIGADIISVAGFLKDIVPLILGHHERWDGTGYPRGLKGDEIPLGSRILAVADVYEAITADRPYHKAISKEEAVQIIREGAGTQFDERIVGVFLEVLGEK